MDLVTTAPGWEFLFRYLHFLAGITWIGVLYYFNFIQTPYFGTELGGSAKSAMTRGLVPNALWWFRWGAMFTFLSGWTIVAMKLMHSGIPLGDGYMTRILTGALMGTFMWANVWFVIWPAQQVVIRSAEQAAAGGEAIPEAAALGARAGLASRTNTLLSLPMLFFMGSASHLPFNNGHNDGLYWLLAGGLITLVELNGIIGSGRSTQKPLASVSGTIHAGLALTVVLYVIGVLVNS